MSRKPIPNSINFFWVIFNAVNLSVSLGADKRALYSVTPTMKHLLAI